MTMKKYISFIVIACLSLSVLSCDSWLDVKPKQMVDEEDFFSREDGFKEALTGIYITLAKDNLYGQRLTYDFLDIIAQRYDPVTYGTGEHPYQQVELYDFTNTSTVNSARVGHIWDNMYTVIANINNMLGWIDKKQSVFVTENYYEIIKGEGLALRAFVHFDLLRMFGPIYKENPTGKSIIYRTEFNRDIKDLVPANEMLGYIISDLEAAEELLEGRDPLAFDENEPNYYGFLVGRQNRMNLMAVKAMLARVYLYRGSAEDKAKALAYATEVIQSGKFTLAKNNAKKLLPSEQIFGLYIIKFDERTGDDFEDQLDRSSVNIDWYISNRAFWQNIANLPEDTETDWRMNDITGFNTVSNGAAYVTQKFMGHGTATTMPVIRLAEMYYIVTECEPDLDKAANYLNTVRISRAITVVDLYSEAERLRQLELEYRKEFYGEGQVWYFYKRHFYSTFVNNPVSRMLQANYVFSIPEGEVAHGGVTE